jgi:hypothetical protein
MTELSRPLSTDAGDGWVDALLARDAAEHAADYVADGGFTVRVMHMLPAPMSLPAWRKPFVTALWLVAAALVASMLPGTAQEIARAAFRLVVAQPFSLSTVALVLAAIGVATWTGAALALRSD